MEPITMNQWLDSGHFRVVSLSAYVHPNYAEAYHNRALARFLKNQYDKAWEDLERFRQLGGRPHPGFVEALREALK